MSAAAPHEISPGSDPATRSRLWEAVGESRFAAFSTPSRRRSLLFGVGGEIAQWNLAAELLRGRVLGDAEVRCLSDLVSPQAAVGLSVARWLAGTSWSGVIAVVGRDGETVVLDMTLIPFLQHTPEGVVALAMFADVTTQLTEGATASMRRIPQGEVLDRPPISFEPLEGVGMPPALARVEASSDASVVIVGTKIAYASHAALDMIGAHGASDVVGTDVLDFVAPSSIESTVARQESAKAGIWPRPETITILTVDGREKQVEVASTPVLWEGQPASQMTMWEPLTSADRLRQLATGVRTDVADAVVITDTEFRIRSLNHAAEQLYGWKESEVLGIPIQEVIPWLGGDTDLETFLHRLHDEGRWHGLAVHGHRDGGAVHVLASTTLLTDSSGQPAGAISVNRVATEESAAR